MPDKKWTRLIGTDGYDSVGGLSIWNDFIIVTGIYGSIESQEEPVDLQNIFVGKYNNQGDKQWFKRLSGNTEYAYIDDICLASDESIFIIGQSVAYEESLDVIQNSNSLLAKYDSAGHEQWKTYIGLTEQDFIYDISTTSDGSVYVTGLTFVGQDGLENTKASVFLSKYSNEGDNVSTQLIGSNDYSYIDDACVSSDGSIFITGLTYGDQDENTDVNISKYNPDGIRDWSQAIEVAEYNYNGYLSIASDGSICLIGLTYGVLDEQVNEAVIDLTVTKYQSDGAKQSTQLIQVASYDFVYAIASSSDGSIVISGEHSGNLDDQKSEGGVDVFIGKYALNSPTVAFIDDGIGTAGAISSSTANVFQEGVSLIAATVTGDIDGDSNAPSYTYRWHKNGAAIAAATSSRYVVPATGTGTYKVAISYTDSQGFRSTIDSADQTVASVNNGKAVFVISGSAAVGETLYAEVLNVDPDANGAFSYMWQASDGSNWLDIGTDSSISIAQPEEGKQLQLLTSYSDGQGFLEDVITSAGYIPFVNDGKAQFIISGVAAVGEILSAELLADDPDGNGDINYRWQARATGILDVDSENNWTDIGSGSSISISKSEEGKHLRLLSNYADGQGFSELVTTSADRVPFINDSQGVVFILSGGVSFQEGITLFTSPVVGDLDGDSFSPNYSYQWYKDSLAIVDATNPTYTIPATDAGTYNVEVTYSDLEDFRDIILSAPQVVEAIDNGSGLIGSITSSTEGVFQEGVTLYAPDVTDDPDGDSTNPNYSYQWYKNGAIINGAIGSSMLIPVGGFGKYKVSVNYTDNELNRLELKSNDVNVASYEISPSAAVVNERSRLLTSVYTKGLSPGSKLYYSMTGIGISSSDFSSGSLTGSGRVDSSGKFVFMHSIASDFATEGSERLEIKLYTDHSLSLQVGNTANVQIIDTSLTPLRTYTLIPSSTVINEGSVFNATVKTTGLRKGSRLYYSFSGVGITSQDFTQGELTGTAIVDANGSFSLSRTLAKDLLTEGKEILQVKLFSDVLLAQQVGNTFNLNINDTSFVPVETYLVTPSSATINEGSIITTQVKTTGVKPGKLLYYSIGGNGITREDLAGSSLVGIAQVNPSGMISFSHTIANDQVTEGNENLEIKLYSDINRSLQVGSTAIISIVDTSKAFVSTITPSASTFTEGQTLSVSIAASNLALGTRLYYSLSGTGITVDDFSTGEVPTGFVTLDASGKSSFSRTLANDKTTEGSESIDIKLFSNSSLTSQIGSTAKVLISDTSVSSSIDKVESFISRFGTINNDYLTGMGSEAIFAGYGNDVLIGSSALSQSRLVMPSILSGGVGNDLYRIPGGSFAIIMDSGAGVDTIFAESMKPNNLSVIRVNNKDIYVTDGITSVLVVDPLGIDSGINRIENFIIGNKPYKTSELLLDKDVFIGDKSYQELGGLGFLNFQGMGFEPSRIEQYIFTATINNTSIV